MKEALLELIREITARREQEGKHPTFATRIDIDQAINKALNDLYSEGKIQAGKTMNGKWIQISE